MSNTVTLYCAKINLNSSHIFDIYDEVYDLKEILKMLYESISNDITNRREDRYSDVVTYRAKYYFENINKNESELFVTGRVIKDTPLFANQRDDDNKPIKVAVDNEETIEFYLDVMKEIVIFHTTKRFGYLEFTEAMQRLINTGINNVYGSEEEFYNFEVSLLKENLDLDNIKSELQNLGGVESIRIDIIPPNPDPNILEEIQKNGEKRLEYLKNGNVTYKSTLLQSRSTTGITLNSEIVNEELDEAVNLHSKLSSEEALSKGYVQVEATSTGGRTYSTKNKQLVKYSVDKDYIEDFDNFIKFCKKSVLSLFN